MIYRAKIRELNHVREHINGKTKDASIHDIKWANLELGSLPECRIGQRPLFSVLLYDFLILMMFYKLS
jgi:hypothetical protein